MGDNEQGPKEAPVQPLLRVASLHQRIGRRAVLRNVSFEVLPGECFGIFGLAGSGKTALIHILAGVDRFTSGSVEVLGQDIRKTEKFKQFTGLVTQERSLFQDLTAGENLDFIAALKNAKREAIPPLVERLALEDYLKTPVSRLDAGVYQRLSLACALLNEPRLLLADELIAGFDLDSRRLILDELAGYLERGGTCVWAFSSMEFAGLMSRVGWLENGELTVYSPQAAGEKWNELKRSSSRRRGEAHV